MKQTDNPVFMSMLKAEFINGKTMTSERAIKAARSYPLFDDDFAITTTFDNKSYVITHISTGLSVSDYYGTIKQASIAFFDNYDKILDGVKGFRKENNQKFEQLQASILAAGKEYENEQRF